MRKAQIKLSIHRPDGRASTVTLADPTPEMLAHAEALLTHLTFGQNPDRPCAACGRPHSDHRVKHPFREHPQR